MKLKAMYTLEVHQGVNILWSGQVARWQCREQNVKRLRGRPACLMNAASSAFPAVLDNQGLTPHLPQTFRGGWFR